MKSYMNSNEFINGCLVTENKDFEGIKNRLSNEKSIRLLHGILGVSTEAGELEDALKKFIFYDKEFDDVNAMEEVGDILYYLSIILDELGYSFEEVMEINNKKLRARYPDGFSEYDATHRNLNAERNILEEDLLIIPSDKENTKLIEEEVYTFESFLALVEEDAKELLGVLYESSNMSFCPSCNVLFGGKHTKSCKLVSWIDELESFIEESLE